VILCCYNSSKRLPDTLTHLANQEFNTAIPWEIILVDNNSRDNTLSVAEGTWRLLKGTASFKTVIENKQGLAHARRRGIDESRFDYLLFCDDDNWLEKSYIENAFEILENNPTVGMAGGWSEAVLEGEPPEWFERYKGSYIVGRQAPKSGILSNRTYLWGAGLVMRKSVFSFAQKLNFKSYMIDREGDKLSSGGDSELCNWALLLGYQLWYDERLRFKHFIPNNRVSIEYANQLNEGFAKASYWLSKYDYHIFLKHQNRSRLTNFAIGIAKLIFRSGSNRSHLQFMIGPIWKISTENDYQFVKTYYRFIYEFRTPKQLTN